MKKLSWRSKNKLLIVGTAIMLLMSWPLAIQRTWNSILVYKTLTRKVETPGDLSLNPNYLIKEHGVLSKTVAIYTVDSGTWVNEFWLKASGGASGKGILVTYAPQKAKNDIDTAGSAVLRSNISFSAGFSKLVALLDTLERTAGVGLVTSATFQTQRMQNAGQPEKLHMHVVFSVVKKE